MECRSKPPEEPQFYTDPATGEETDCWLICGTSKVPVLCDNYCPGYCDPDLPTTEITPTTKPDSPSVLSNGEIILIVAIAIISAVLIISLLVAGIIKRRALIAFCDRRIKQRNNNATQRNYINTNDNGGDRNRKPPTITRQSQTDIPVTFTKTNEQKSTEIKQNRGLLDQSAKSDGTISESQQSSIKERQNSREETEPKSMPPPESVFQRRSSSDTGVGSMSHPSHDTEMGTARERQSQPRAPVQPVQNPTETDTDDEHACVSYVRSSNGREVSHPSHSYSENNKLVTTPTENDEAALLFSGGSSVYSGHRSNLVSQAPYVSGMDGELAEDFKSLMHNTN